MNDSLLKYRKYVRPELARVLSALKLDNVYEKAFADKLFYEKNGQETSVSDFLGGFGSTILGHNHSDILLALETCQKNKKPQHAQASLKKEAALLAESLNGHVKNKLHDSRDFITTFANSGTEAVEVALKHALLEWNEKKIKTILKIKTQLIRQKAVPQEIAKKIEDYCDRLEALAPVMLSLEKSFHGKTSGSIALTANSAYKKMFQTTPIGVKFFSLDEADSMVDFIKRADRVLELSSEMKISFSPIVGFIYEPIQGEGGIEEVPKNFLYSISDELKKRHVPLICDEIQSGLFRTGKFLASEWFQMNPDYILLGKSLGGGVAKISATMIAHDHYVDEFGWIHTSTFAEDDWSSVIAHKTLELLFARENEIEERARAFEEKMQAGVCSLQKKYPNVIRLMKGRGFFLGIEFNFGENAPLTDLLNGFYEQGHATYLFTSYLLHHHQVRVGVTLSAPEIIRLEPSAFVTEESVEKLLKGLDELCRLLSERKNLALISHLWNKTFSHEELETISEKKSAIVESHSTDKVHIGFLTHVVNPIQAQSLDLALKHVPPQELDLFFKNYSQQSAPFRYYQKTIKGENGREIELNLYGIMQPSSFFEESLRNGDMKAVRCVQEAVDLAQSHGMKYFGLGQFTSIVSENGLLLSSPGMPLTTGNSLTAAMAIEGIKKAAKEKNLDLKKIKIGVVGFTGNICNVLTQIIADDVTNLVLIHRESLESSKKSQNAVDLLLKETTLKKENLTFTHDLGSLKDCDVVIVGTNSSIEIIESAHIKEGAIVLDISVPSNVQSAVKKRADVSYFQGGLARLPFSQVVDHAWVPLKNGDCFACMTETIVMGLMGKNESYSLGRLNKAQVLESLLLAQKVGVTLGGLRTY
ncbi:MAG: aminotransferase class III-fold pyridoxal phosphate-dependent enzyme [Bacteriovorax sp.]